MGRVQYIFAVALIAGGLFVFVVTLIQGCTTSSTAPLKPLEPVEWTVDIRMCQEFRYTLDYCLDQAVTNLRQGVTR